MTEFNPIKSMVYGSMWMIGMRWSMKFISLGSTIVLIRYLSPQDFGLMANAMILVGLVEVFLDSGFRQVLIQKKETFQEDYDTVFTLNMLMGSIVFLVLWGISYPAASFFQEESLQIVVACLGLRGFIYGISSPKTANFLRELNYSRDFWYNITPQLVRVPATILIAITYQDYRALLGGQLIGQICSLLLSYKMAPYLPRLSLKTLPSIWKTSLSFIGANYATYVAQRMDEMFLMMRRDHHILGYYNVASEIGSLLTYEILYPLTRSLFPVLSKLRHDEVQFRQVVSEHILSVVWAVAVFCGGTTYLMRENLMLLLGGEKWSAAINILGWIGIASGLHMTNLLFGTVLQVLEKTALQALLLWIKIILLSAGLWIVFSYYDHMEALEPLAMVRTLIMGIILPLHVFFVCYYIKIGYKQILNQCWRPIIALVSIWGMQEGFPTVFKNPFEIRILDFFYQGMVILILYLLLLGGLWILVGKPKGVEKIVSEKILLYYRIFYIKNKKEDLSS